MFADLKNEYEDISAAEYSKWIENWLATLADLVEGENNFDDTLEETNEHFLKVCGKVYEPVGYSFNYFNCIKDKIIEDAELVDTSWSDRAFGFEVDLG